MNVYTIRDAVAGFFLPPFLARNDGQATRMFVGSLGDSFPYREGFMLYHIGEFSDENGTIASIDPKLVIAGNSIDPKLDPRVTKEAIQ